jgi:deazaflavin-dependent oxidoreductase (nitroreductase family)
VLGAALRCNRLSPANTEVDELGEQLAVWGKVVRLETRGRVSGRPLEVALGYVEELDGSVLVAAGSPEADWARNLDADPRCRVRLGERDWADASADPLDAVEAARTVRELILRYGTPAERLGRGPAYRVRPVVAE